MRRLCATLLAVTLLSAPFRAHAQFHLIGVGLNSCGTWTANRAQPNSIGARLSEQWVVGFLFGAASLGPAVDPMNNTDAEGVWAWIDNYCHANPLDTISIAAAHFTTAHPK
jgi:hypothetical protein